MNAAALRRILAIMVKESLQIVRDPSSILIGFILPVFLTLLSGYSTNLDLDHLPVGLALEDGSPEARSLAAAFSATPYFTVRMGRDRREFADDLTRGSIRGLVIIPQTFGRDLSRADAPVPFQVIADGSEPNTATFLQNYAQGVWSSWMEIRAGQAGQDFAQYVELAPRTWFNQELLSLNSLLPGGMAINLTLIGALLTALVVAREWERGTMEALLATPISPAELLAGKLIPYFVLGLAALCICLILTRAVFHVPYRGSMFALTAVSSVFLVSALALGLFISTVAKNQFVASQIAILSAFLPAYFLSGYVFEPSGMPPAVRLLTHVIAAKYYVSCLKTLFLAGDAWPLLWPNIWGMAAIAAALLGLTLMMTRRRVA
jgi:ABC-2 type transport system permease protein